MPVAPTATLDAVLSLQLLVAWAGESSRLGWWSTNLIDPDAGLDLLHRLAPRTAAWAGWELVRAAAIATDAERRNLQANRERVVTLFHLGAAVDEALTDRLRELKMTGGALAGLPAPDARFDRQAFAASLAALGDVDTEARASGRRVKAAATDEPLAQARLLAAALLPLADHYPLPYLA